MSILAKKRLNIDIEKVAEDPYHRILSMSWSAFFILALLVFLSVNSIFAMIYMQDPGGIKNMPSDDFMEHFFFSVQTISTIGYGYYHPITSFTQSVMVVQVFTGMVNLALATGIVFAKFSLPSSKIIFSNNILMTDFDGTKSLVFRLANQRKNHIVDAKIHLNIAFNETTKEGVPIRRFYPLYVKKRHTPLFALSWTIVHNINEDSVLFTKTPEQLEGLGAEIYATVVGIDGTFSQNIYSSKIYDLSDWVYGGQFEDFLGAEADGAPVLDFSKISNIVRTDT